MKKLIALSLSLLMILGTTSIALADPKAEKEYTVYIYLILPKGASVTGKIAGTGKWLRNDSVKGNATFSSDFFEDESGRLVYSFRQPEIEAGDTFTFEFTNPPGYTGKGTFVPDDSVPEDGFQILYIFLTDGTAEPPSGDNNNIAEELDYPFTSGVGQTWDDAATTGLSFTVKTTNQNFLGVGMDTTGLVPTDCYTRDEETNTFILTPAYLRTLKEGEHTIRFRYGDGMAETTFTITHTADAAK